MFEVFRTVSSVCVHLFVGVAISMWFICVFIVCVCWALVVLTQMAVAYILRLQDEGQVNDFPHPIQAENEPNYGQEELVYFPVFIPPRYKNHLICAIRPELAAWHLTHVPHTSRNEAILPFLPHLNSNELLPDPSHTLDFADSTDVGAPFPPLLFEVKCEKEHIPRAVNNGTVVTGYFPIPFTPTF